jgi:DNA-directed RNA polymerase subunit RPC12/RpoP
MMTYGDPELELDPPCPSCGFRAVFTAVAPPGDPRLRRDEMPLYPACVRCGRERDDLAGFYADPPTQPQRFAGFL